MPKFILNNTSTYSEIFQTNPIRWKTLYKNPDGSFVDQSGWFKCKDFFNDNVAWFQGKRSFSIYRYVNDVLKNDEGFYILVKHLKDFKQFQQNMLVVNEQLVKDKLDTVEVWSTDEEDQALLLFPNSVLTSTYIISLLTMCIRVCNYGVLYTKWDDLWAAGNPARELDGAFDDKAYKLVDKWKFRMPTKYKKYWYYSGSSFNSMSKPDISPSIIHDNGVVSWAANVLGEA